jgi:uncharacterized protein (TIGR02231 family)
MVKRLSTLILVLFCGTLAAQESQNITADSKIKSVTVFSDRAAVKRSLSWLFPKGTITIEVPRLPAGLIDESMRVSGYGASGAKILSVRVERTFTEDSSAQRIKDMRAQIKEIDKRMNALSDREEVLKKKKDFIQILSGKTGESIARDLPSERLSAADWAGMLNFIDGGLDSVNLETRAIAEEKEALYNRKLDLQNRAGTFRDGPGNDKKGVVELSVEKPGTFTFELSYMIRGAGWYPVYDIRSWSDTSAVELVYMAMVNQQTGEDWNDVDLELSTARPSVGANPPELSARYLNVIEPVEHARKGVVTAMPSSSMEDYIHSSPAFIGGTMGQVQSQYATVDVSRQGVSTSFIVKLPQTILSSKESKKVPIKTVSFSSEAECIAVPGYSEYAYTKANVVNGADFPLLRGSANVFFDDNFVSTASIPLVLPREKFDLYSGVDEGIKVKKELVQEYTDDSGIMNKKRRVSYEYKISIQNFRKTDKKLTVLDQYPVSQNEQIEVKLSDITPEPRYSAGDQEQGFLRWTYDLKPLQKEQVKYKYQVRYPQEITISGLN